jgi:hypothetical protein
MELEDLKTIWKQSEADFRLKDEAQIASMLKGKSMSIIAKLKRSVWFELVFALIVSVVLLVYAITLKPGAFKWTAISLLLMCLGSSIYFSKKLMLLNRFQEVNENLHVTISTLITNLNGYLRFYKNSYTILYPVYFSLGILFAALERGPKKFMEFLLQPTIIIYLLLMAGIFFFVSTWFANWYIKKLYGDHLQKLQGLLDDLNNSLTPLHTRD